jgi:hypothetical protein
MIIFVRGEGRKGRRKEGRREKCEKEEGAIVEGRLGGMGEVRKKGKKCT